MNNIKILTVICFMLVLIVSCEKDEHEPITTDTQAPKPLTEVSVENLPGAARLTYVLPPDNPHLMYIKAVFETQGKERSAIATFYNNSLLLEGFGDTLEHEVKVYTVSRGELHSEPVVVKVNPKIPPIRLTFESLNLKETFGGVYASYSNTAEADLAITIIHKDSTDAWITDEVLYTASDSGEFAARGFDVEPTTFGIFVRDRWNNFSDTLITELTPIFEIELDKNNFDLFKLPTDYTKHWRNNNKWSIQKLWDNDFTTGYNTDTDSQLPLWFTLDLGTTSKLSRFLYKQRGAGEKNGPTWYWAKSSPRYFEIWGRADTPEADGSWNGWTKLLDVESVKPSGLPLGDVSDEDVALAEKGEEFSFPPSAPPVRYLRIKINETWGKDNLVSLSEFSFWGQ